MALLRKIFKNQSMIDSHRMVCLEANSKDKLKYLKWLNKFHYEVKLYAQAIFYLFDINQYSKKINFMIIRMINSIKNYWLHLL